MEQMSKKERLMAAVKGDPVDRIPVSFFGHNHTVERTPETALEAMIEQDRKYDWDVMKVQMRATYYAEAWGNTYKWMGPKIGPEVQDHVVKQASDFRKLKKVDVSRGVFADHVGIAKKIGEVLKGRTPYVQTVFNPIGVADMLAGTHLYDLHRQDYQNPRIGPLKRLMEENPEAVHEGLSLISQTLADYAREAVQRGGALGIFISTWRWAMKDVLTEEQYETFGKPYDLAVINGAIQAGSTFNVLHICRDPMISFDTFADYPVDAINYTATCPGNPSLREVKSRWKKAFWGGIDHTQTLLHGPADAIDREVQEVITETGGKRLIVGPGCAIPIEIPAAHLLAVKSAISRWGKG